MLKVTIHIFNPISNSNLSFINYLSCLSCFAPSYGLHSRVYELLRSPDNVNFTGKEFIKLVESAPSENVPPFQAKGSL